MKRTKTLYRTLAITAVACLLCFSIILAGKPDKPGGGGGGGGGGGAAYNIIPFAPFGDSSSVSTTVRDMNDVGEVIGGVSAPHSQSYHLDLATGQYTPIPGVAIAINNVGQIVSKISVFNEPQAFFLSSPGAELVPLPLLDGDNTSYASDINDAGIIVGRSDNTAVAWRAVVDPEGLVSIDGPVTLVPLDGDPWSFASRINDSYGSMFQVTGDSFGGGHTEAVVWSVELDSNGFLVEASPPEGLGILGLRADNPYSLGHGINTFGDICGVSDYLPFIDTIDGAMQLLLPVPRGISVLGIARDINDLGDIVGDYNITKKSGARSQCAYLWPADSDGIDLNKLISKNSGWVQLKDAYRINIHGMIAGRGFFNEANRGFILIPNE